MSCLHPRNFFEKYGVPCFAWAIKHWEFLRWKKNLPTRRFFLNIHLFGFMVSHSLKWVSECGWLLSTPIGMPKKITHTHISHHTIWFLLKKTQKSASRMEDSWRIHILYVWKNQLSGKLLHLENLRKSFTGAAVLYLPRSFLNGGLLLGMATLVPWKWQLFAARKPLSDEILNLVSSPCFCKRCGIAT